MRHVTKFYSVNSKLDKTR